MAQSIKYVLPYGTEVGSRGVTLNVMAELYDGTTLLARRLIQGITSEADRDEKANALFDGIKAPELPPSVPSTVGWKTTVAKASKAEIG